MTTSFSSSRRWRSVASTIESRMTRALLSGWARRRALTSIVRGPMPLNDARTS